MPRGSWSAPELMRLRELFPRNPPDRVARLLGRSVESVQRRVRRMFAAERRRGPWTTAEDRRLQEAIGVHDLDTMALLVGRAPEDVAERLDEFRRRSRHGPWSDDDVLLLKRLHGTRLTADLAVALSRSPEAIEAKAAELRLAKDKATGGDAVIRMPRWTADDVARLRELYASHDNLSIARILDRSVASIANKASQLGLGKGRAALREMGRRNLARRRGR